MQFKHFFCGIILLGDTMTTKINIIISIIILILIIISKIYLKKKHKEVLKKDLYKKSSNLIKLLYLLSAILFITSLIINLVVYGNNPDLNSTITYLINALSISLLAMPLSLNTLYITSFKNEENISHIKTIVTNIINPKTIQKLKKASINVVVISKNTSKLKFPIIEESEITSKKLKQNIIINSDNLKIANKYIDKGNTYFEFKNLEEAYEKIYKARGTHDNYIRTIKYLITTYLPLILSYLLLNLVGFPVEYNILLVVILKLFTILTSELLYKKMPFDTDIMERKPKPENILVGKQELIFSILESFIILFVLNVPYMLILSEGGTTEFANTLYYIIFVYINLYMTLSYFSESNIIKNIFKSLKHIRMIIYILLCVGISLLFNFTTYFNTRNIYLHNFIACVLFSILAVSLNELIKFARFTTTKGRKKHESKNNKKRSRS